MNKAKRFRELLGANRHFFLMEAHDGLSSKIVEEAGFPAVWASGLSITASLGVRDNNEISYTQLLDVLEYMNDACDLPILVDGDTGYGNFNNACRLLRKLEQLGIAGICIEDKKFPKTNSFLETKINALADPLEFSGKIRAMKAAQTTSDFIVVARLESLIVGAGMDDAVKRAEMYLDAGADALLVHSKRSTSKDIDNFLAAFNRDVPIFIVPTKYYTVPIKHLTKDSRVRGIIWANHNIRACITAMKEVSDKIYKDGSIANVEDTIATVSEIFRLQKNEEYLEMEGKYLPHYPQFGAAILAGGSPGSLRYNKPKSLLSINGKSILQRQIDSLTAIGVSNIAIVRGYKKEEIDVPNCAFIDNDEWQSTNVMYSLSLVAERMEHPYFVLHGDVFFKRYLLKMMLDCASEHVDADLILVCIKENYIDNGFALKLDKRLEVFGNNENISIAEVMDGRSFHEENTVYFSGLMLVNNHLAVRRILNGCNPRNIHTADFLRCAIEDGLNIPAIVSSRDAIVDINSINDLLKAGEIYD
jgi:phosphoenolpyruvate phosphomutase